MIAYWNRGLEWMGEGLLGAWCPSFTGPTSLAVLDVSGNAYHGTLNNLDRNTAWVTNGERVAVSYPGIDTSNVQLGSISRFPTFNWTVCSWTNVTSSNSGLINISNLTGTRDNLHLYIASNANINFNLRLDDAFVGGLPALFGRWIHIAWTFDAGFFGRFYLNGVQIGTKQYGGAFVGNRISRLGNGDGNRPMNGFIDDSRFYERVLTPPEIRQMFESGRAGGMLYQPPKRRSVFIAAGFRAYWHRRQSQLIGGGV